jgi:predicted RNA-binding protein YlxR (DUF448 family)
MRVDHQRARVELLRLVLVERRDGSYDAVVDLGRSMTGRGAWVHTRIDCLEIAARRGLARSAKAAVHADVAELCKQIREGSERRTLHLLGVAERCGAAAIGMRAAAEEARDAALLIMARDAGRAPASLRFGRTLQWGEKAILGEALGRNEVAAVAIRDDGMAAALRRLIAAMETFSVPSDKVRVKKVR